MTVFFCSYVAMEVGGKGLLLSRVEGRLSGGVRSCEVDYSISFLFVEQTIFLSEKEAEMSDVCV